MRPAFAVKVLLVLVSVTCGFSLSGSAQPVVEGVSLARSGMLFYDFRQSTDLADKVYRYTLCPDSAGCISLDFNELDTCDATGFVRVFRKEGETWNLLTTWGGGTGERFLECDASCLAFEFHCSGAAKKSRWNAVWTGLPEGFCIDPMKSREEGIQDLCGPVFVGELEIPADKPRLKMPDGWQPALKLFGMFRFRTATSGDLDFLLKPQNHSDDLNWILWKVSVDSTGMLPSLDSLPEPVAWNHSSGRQRNAITGMHASGAGEGSSHADSPVTKPLRVGSGEQFFLLVENADGDAGKVEIRTGPIVMECANPVDSVVRFESQVISPPSRCGGVVASREILRLDLQTKMNRPLDLLRWHPGLLTERFEKSSKDQEWHSGLVELLLFGVQRGVFPAYVPDRSRTQLHYGDLLTMTLDARDSSTTLPVWLSVDDHRMDAYTHYLEVMVELCTDRVTSNESRRIKQFRLLWADGATDTPDYCVAIINYEDVSPWLRQIRLILQGNEAAETNLDDYLSKHMYEAVPVQVNGKQTRSLGQSQTDQSQQLQVRDFLWGR